MSTVRTLVVNLEGATAVKPKIAQLLALIKLFNVRVVIAVETNDFRLQRALGKGWLVHQGFVNGRQNGAIAIKKHSALRRYGRRFFLGSTGDRRRGKKIGARWIGRLSAFHIPNAEAVCWQFAHVPPRRNSDKYPQFAEALVDSWRPEFTVTGGDHNQLDIESLARKEGLRVFAEDLIFIASSLPFKVVDVYDQPGLDHKALIVDVDLSPTEK